MDLEFLFWVSWVRRCGLVCGDKVERGEVEGGNEKKRLRRVGYFVNILKRSGLKKRRVKRMRKEKIGDGQRERE